MPQLSDLELAYNALSAKQPRHNLYVDFYDGRHPLIYSAERLRQIFTRIDARFTQNWCAVVIDSVLERIQLKQIQVTNDEAATQELEAILMECELLLESDDAHLAALVTGESYLIAWPDETGDVEVFYNDPRNVHLFYAAENPREKRFGCKWWVGDDTYRYLTLYYADRLEYYRSRNAVGSQYESDITGVKDLQEFAPSEPNPYGAVPIFHLRRERRAIKSELANVIDQQNAINKLLADMMVAAEFGAFKQRWIISNADVTQLKNAPNEIWSVPPGDGEGQPTSVGEFGETALGNYLQAIDKLATSIAVITRTPKHYFFGQGGDPSGEALIAMEAPLNKKSAKYIDRFTATWRQLAQFLLQLRGITVDQADIVVSFDPPETVQPLTQALIRKAAIEAGLPLVTALRQEGWTQQELDQLEKDKQGEQSAQQTTLASALVRAQRQFDQGQTNGVAMPMTSNGNPGG